MKTIIISWCFMVMLAANLKAQSTAAATAGLSDLEGAWQVDLRPAPDADPYIQVLRLKIKNNGALGGSFYGSKFKKGVTNTNWPQLHFAFRTQDRNNTYFHTGYLEGDVLRGQTYCPERTFVAPWTAKRRTETTKQ